MITQPIRKHNIIMYQAINHINKREIKIILYMK